MSLVLDASALLGAVIDGRHRALVVDAIVAAQDDGGEHVFASAVALTEALAAIDRLADDESVRTHLHFELRAPFLLDWSPLGEARTIDAFNPYPSLMAADPKRT